MKLYLLDGKEMTSRTMAYRVIGRAMSFPDWFGQNLDALADCLGGLSSDSAVIFVNTGVLAGYLGPYADRLLTCFRDLSEEVGFQWIEKE